MNTLESLIQEMDYVRKIIDGVFVDGQEASLIQELQKKRLFRSRNNHSIYANLGNFAFQNPDQVVSEIKQLRNSSGGIRQFLKRFQTNSASFIAELKALQNMIQKGLNESKESLMAPGGIDMNSNALDLKTEGSDIKFDMPLDPAQWESISFEGFTPVILQIQTTNFPQFIGAKETDSSVALSRV